VYNTEQKISSSVYQ